MELTIRLQEDKQGKKTLTLHNPDQIDDMTILGILKMLEQLTYKKVFNDDIELKKTIKEA